MMAGETGSVRGTKARRVLRWLRDLVAPSPPDLSDEERRALERRLAAFYGDDVLVEVEAAQAAEVDPENPLAPVRDLQTAYDFVLAHYPPHDTPRDHAVALAFAVIVEHVRYAARDAATGRAPRPADLDRFLDDHAPVELIAVLRASPRAWVRRSLKRLRKEVHTEENLELLFVEITARYGGRWAPCPPEQPGGRRRSRVASRPDRRRRQS